MADRSNEGTIWARLTGMFSRRRPEGEHDELEQAVLDATEEGELEPEECSMIQGVLDLDETQVKEIMTPRTDTEFLESGTSVLDTARFVVETGYSRIPVFKGTRDDILGVVHVKDLLPSLLDAARHDDPVDTVMRPALFVPETKPVGELLQELRTNKNHIAIVVDEYGGTSGVVTIEDALEQIVGSIEDEHDVPEEADVRELGNGSLALSGRALLEDLKPVGIDLDSEDVDTVGGYLCLEAGHVPRKDESFVCNGWRFTVKDADAKQIRLVQADPERAEP